MKEAGRMNAEVQSQKLTGRDEQALGERVKVIQIDRGGDKDEANHGKSR